MSQLFMNQTLKELVNKLDIPSSCYQQAKERYEALGNWLDRSESPLKSYDPQIYSQGSFRLGTVVRPISNLDEFDLDLVCQLNAQDRDFTQKELKELIGAEIISYAESNNFKEPAEEKKRCWRLNYQDEISFHMDILPAIPDSNHTLSMTRNVSSEFTNHAVLITDETHPNYTQRTSDWYKSNPKGFAGWFEDKIKPVSYEHREQLVANKEYASVDEIPMYTWKTPLQLAIQILKRHRDIMFSKAPELKPISMIITTLATRAYRGERDLAEALDTIVNHMPDYIKSKFPKVENPVNPKEDFADKWKENQQLEENFNLWHTQLTSDLEKIKHSSDERKLSSLITNAFNVNLSNKAGALISHQSSSNFQPSTPTSIITSPARPWQIKNDK